MFSLKLADYLMFSLLLSTWNDWDLALGLSIAIQSPVENVGVLCQLNHFFILNFWLYG